MCALRMWLWWCGIDLRLVTDCAALCTVSEVWPACTTVSLQSMWLGYGQTM